MTESRTPGKLGEKDLAGLKALKIGEQNITTRIIVGSPSQGASGMGVPRVRDGLGDRKLFHVMTIRHGVRSSMGGLPPSYFSPRAV